MKDNQWEEFFELEEIDIELGGGNMKTYNYLVVYKTCSAAGSYFTEITVSDKASTKDWYEIGNNVVEYVNREVLGYSEVVENVVITNLVRLNEVVYES